jgi:3',5'-nucleoside bisphosphate phosphatase
MDVFVDLHIHSGLSPCANDDMTPNNIVNMALIKGLDIISVTDHNSMDNVEVICAIAKEKDLVVIPGCEIQTKEEIHLLCYFPSIEAGLRFQHNVIDINLPDIKNRPDIFGQQLLFDKDDSIIGYQHRMLNNSLTLSVEEVTKQVSFYGGVAVPAHIDRPSYSLVSNLGFVPEDGSYATVEISPRNYEHNNFRNQYVEKKFNVITGSDAHDLGLIFERTFCLSIKHLDAISVVDYLAGRCNF